MTILYSAPIGFDTYRNEVRRDVEAMENIMRDEGIAFTPFDEDTREENYFERNGHTDFLNLWEEYEFYSDELIAILASNGISAYADGYAGMFYIEREES